MTSRRERKFKRSKKQPTSTEALSRRMNGLSTTCSDGIQCFGETACRDEKNGTFTCYCYHTGKPAPPDWDCPRNTVTGFPEPFNLGGSETQAKEDKNDTIQVQVLKNNSRLQQLPTSTSHPSSSSSFEPAHHVTAIVSLSFLFMFLLLLATFCFLKRRTLKRYLHFHCQQGKLDQKIQPLGNGGGLLMNGQLLPADRFVMNPTYETSALVDLAIPIFLSSEINILTQIGQGCFGKVFKGELGGGLVAVKVAKREHTEDALKEVETMAAFNHQNILRMIGVAKNEDEVAPWLVFEFMEYGDLASVLRATGNSKGLSETLEQKPYLTKDSLFDIAYQVAEGMKYLSSQHFVHRDLAARNCLVGRNGVVKISDFGLSRDVYTCDYYKIGGSRLLPVRWMSPESVLYGRFTLESDVWAYGILLWEITSWGKQPYYGHSNEEVVQLILDGVLLCPPHDCPPAIRDLMAGCWKSDPKDRLKFTLITDRFLKNLKESQLSDSSGSDDYEVPKPKSPTVEYMQVV